MRKTTFAVTCSIILLGAAGTAAFAAHDANPAADGPANMQDMPGMEGMADPQGMTTMQGMPMAGGAMPMQGMMPMMMGMMPMMAMMPMGGQPMAGTTGMAAPAATPEAVPAGLAEKLDLLIASIDSLTARIEALEAPAAN